MNLPIDRRVWLRKNGWTVGERGRFSSVMWDAMDEAERNGTAFLDKKAGTTIGTGSIVDEDGNRQITTVEINPYAHHPEPHRTNAYYTFKGPKVTSQISVREACITCSYSLGWCYCDVPKVRDWRTGEVISLVG